MSLARESKYHAHRNRSTVGKPTSADVVLMHTALPGYVGVGVHRVSQYTVKLSKF